VEKEGPAYDSPELAAMNKRTRSGRRSASDPTGSGASLISAYEYLRSLSRRISRRRRSKRIIII